MNHQIAVDGDAAFNSLKRRLNVVGGGEEGVWREPSLIDQNKPTFVA